MVQPLELMVIQAHSKYYWEEHIPPRIAASFSCISQFIIEIFLLSFLSFLPSLPSLCVCLCLS